MGFCFGMAVFGHVHRYRRSAFVISCKARMSEGSLSIAVRELARWVGLLFFIVHMIRVTTSQGLASASCKRLPSLGSERWPIPQNSPPIMTLRGPRSNPFLHCKASLQGALKAVHSNSETRRPKAEARIHSYPHWSSSPSGRAILGFRASAFFRASGFGLRISGLRDMLCLQLA